jgi:poly-beta-hydroxybutyrate-responsive repressor
MGRSSRNSDNQPGSGKKERFMQPSVLMALLKAPSYGYELIHSIQDFGFVQGQAPPGMIYRHLRQLEDDGLVTSEWETGGTGAAKRIYHITPEGQDVLASWIEYMAAQADKLSGFISIYRRLTDGGEAEATAPRTGGQPSL